MFQDKLKKPVEINCGLIGFTVRDGVAAADPILIDTDKNVMTATGGFSFKDESLDVRFRADGKKFSLFSGQSPVGINGHFAAPGIQIISPELLTRGGARAGARAWSRARSRRCSPSSMSATPRTRRAARCWPARAPSAQRTTEGEPRKDVGTGKPPATRQEAREEEVPRDLLSRVAPSRELRRAAPAPRRASPRRPTATTRPSLSASSGCPRQSHIRPPAPSTTGTSAARS